MVGVKTFDKFYLLVVKTAIDVYSSLGVYLVQDQGVTGETLIVFALWLTVDGNSHLRYCAPDEVMAVYYLEYKRQKILA